MKKIIAILAVMLLGFSLVGCITGDDPAGGNTNTTVTLAQAQENVNNALKNIVFDDDLLNNVTANLMLASKNARYPNVKFAWSSSEPDIVLSDGTVNRPDPESGDERLVDGTYIPVTLTVVLTETATDGSVATATKSFELKVIAVKIDLEGTVAQIKQTIYAGLVENGVALNTNDADHSLFCVTTARVLYKWSKSMIVSDGTGAITVYGDFSQYKEGDLVQVQGEVYSYYGQVEFGADIQVAKAADDGSIVVNEYVDAQIDEYTKALTAAVDEKKNIVDQKAVLGFSGATYNLYALVLAEDLGCGDDYALEDPLTGTRISIYHYATDGEEDKALIDQYVGKYVYIKAITIDRYSSNDVYRVLWNGEKPIEAEAPNLTDEEKVNLAKTNLAFNVGATGEYTLPTEAYGATIAWELVDGGEVATLNENVLTVTQGTASYTIKVNATITAGEASEVVELTCLVAQEGPMPIGEALELADGTAVVLKGKVKSIDTAWSDQYGNITVTIEDETGSIQLFRLATNVKVGQVIVVTGEMGSFKDNRQVAAGATAVLVGGEVTVAEAKALEDGAEVVLVGTVKSIDTPWSDEYNNITVTIEDETGAIQLFRLATNVEVGAKIKVTGVVGSYNGNKQIAAGATAEVVVEDEEPEIITITEALAAADGTEVVVKGTVTIAGAWNTQYNNMNVTIADEEGNELYIYRLGTQVAEGNVIVVTGTMATYNSARQIGQGGTAVLVGGEVTVAEAATLEDGAEVVLVGTVKSIDTPWSDEYNNITVTLEDETGTISLYRLSTNVEVGAKIKVTGAVGSHNGVKQIAKGATAEVIVEEEVVEGTQVAVFEFGADDAAKTNEASQDGSEISEYTETSGNYTLTLSGLSKVYGGSYDAKGNACLKMGTGSKAGTLTFTVAEDVDYVIIKVAGYKSNAAKIVINDGEAQTVSTFSANGEYTEIRIDTTTVKTITLTTVSGGYRCKVTSVAFFKVEE